MRTSLFKWLVAAVLTFYLNPLIAQMDCAVNAGSDDPNYCLGQNMILYGNVSGNIDLSTVEWELVDKPLGSNVQIDNPFSINAGTSPADVVGTYVFRLSAECNLGQTFQEVVYIVNTLPEANIEPVNDLGCVPVNHILQILGNEPGAGETVLWEIISGEVILSSFNTYDPEMTILCGFGDRLYSDTKRVKLRYTVSTSNGCSASDIIEFEYYSYEEPELRHRHLDCDSCYQFIIDQCMHTTDYELSVIESPEGFEYDPDKLNATYRICNPIIGDYKIQFVNNGFCGTDTSILELYMNAMFSPVLFEVKDSSIFLCASEIEPSDTMILIPDITDPGLDAEWSQSFGKPVEIIDPSLLVLKITDLSPGSYSFAYNLKEESYCPQVLFVYRINIFASTDFVMTNGGRRDELRFCADLVDVSGAFELDTFQFLKQKHYFELISFPAGFDDEDSIKFEIVENTIRRPEDDSLCFSMNNRDYEGEFFSDYLGKSNLFSLKCTEVTRPGIYTISISVEYPCAGWIQHQLDIEVIFKDSLMANAGTDIIVPCGVDSVELAGNLNNGIWSVQEAPTGAPPVIFDDLNSKNPLLTNLVPGEYVLNYTGYFVDGVGCNGRWESDQVHVVISDSVPIEFDLGPEIVLCASDQFEFFTSDSLPFGSWSQLSGDPVFWSEEDDRIVFQNLSDPGEYSFLFTAENGCGSQSDTLFIEVIDAAFLTADIITQDSCINFTSNFTFPLFLQAEDPGNGNTGTWSFLGTGTANFSPNSNSTNVEVTVSGASTRDFLTFIWTVENEQCPNVVRDTVVFKQDFLSFPLDLSPFTDCSANFPDTVEVTLGPLPDGTDITWSLQSQIPNGTPPQMLQDDQDTILVVFFETGEYSFIMNAVFDSDCGYQEIAESKVVKLSEVQAAAWAGEDLSICADSAVFTLCGQPEDLQGIWSIVEAIPQNLSYDIESPDSNKTTISLSDPGRIVLDWSVFAEDPSCGISSSDLVELEYVEFEIAEDTIIVCGDEPIVISRTEYLADSVLWTITPSVNFDLRHLQNGAILIENLPYGEYVLKGELQSVDCGLSDNIYILKEIIPTTTTDSVSYCLSAINNAELQLPYIESIEDDYKFENVELIRRPGAYPGGDSIILNRQDQLLNYRGINQEGKYVFRYVFSNGVCETVMIWSVNISEQVFLNFPDTLVVCEGDELNLNFVIDPNVEFNWSPGDNIDFSDPEIPIWSGANDEWLFVNYNILGDTACSNMDSVRIEVLNLPLYDPIVDTSLCFADSICLDLGADSVLGIEWYDIDENRSIQTGDSLKLWIDRDRNIAFQYGFLDEGSCTISDSIQIRFLDLNAELPEILYICERPIDTILAIVVDSEEEWSFIWQDDPSIEGVTDSSVVQIVPDQTTDYFVELMHESGCTIDLSTTVVIAEFIDSLRVFADPGQIRPGESTQLVVVPGNEALEYDWSPGIYLSDSTIYNPVASPVRTIRYTVTARQGICVDTASILIDVVNECKPPHIYIPNAFTPNGDLLNDTYKVMTDQAEEFYIAIYNRWGERVFESRDINEGWDGYYNGKKLSPDVYAYYLRIGCYGDLEYIHKGNITILY